MSYGAITCDMRELRFFIWLHTMMEMLAFTHLLPQISRFFSAKRVQQKLYTMSTAALNISLLALVLGNSTQFKATNIPYEIDQIVQSPFSISAHFNAAKVFKGNNIEFQKTNEIRLVHDLIAAKEQTNVLGDSTDISNAIEVWDSEPKQLEEKLAYWKTVISEHPDYRDAYLQASYIANLLNQKAEASFFMERAKKLDPSL